MDVVGLGFATVDVLATVPRLPGPDDVFRVLRTTVQGGGPVATALVTIARLGGAAAYLGSVGQDDWGRSILEDFARNGVDTSCVRVMADGSSAISVILVHAPTGARSILYDPGSLPDFTFGPTEDAAVRAARVLHLDGWHLGAAIAAAHAARQAGVVVSFDGGAGEAWRGIEELLPLVDVMVVARQFARNVTGATDPLLAGPLLCRWGAREVVITDGAAGCWYWDAHQSLHQPAFKVDVVDTTGAGDVFHGGYIYGLLQDWPPQKRLAFASATAALKCTQPGGRLGIPTRDQVMSFLAG